MSDDPEWESLLDAGRLARDTRLATPPRREAGVPAPKTGRVRGKTEASLAVGRSVRRHLRIVDNDSALWDAEPLPTRPRTRGECEGAPRPCVWVGCRHNNYLDVNPETGAIKFNFPHLEPDQMAESCSLDVADRGGVTLEEVGAATNLTRERSRQIETMGLVSLRRAARKRGSQLSLPVEKHDSPLAAAQQI